MTTSLLSPRKSRRATDEVYRILYDRIVRGDLEAGTRLDIDAIVGELDVSRTPVREAIIHLEAAGLVECQPYRGSVVTGVDPARLDEVTALRYDLEGLAAEMGCLRLTDAELARMGAILDDIQTQSTRPDFTFETFNRLNREFHATLYSAADSPTLTRLIQQLGIDADRMRAHFAAPRDTSHAEHRAILDACLARDPQAAGDAMRHHILAAFEALTGHKPAPDGAFSRVLTRHSRQEETA